MPSPTGAQVQKHRRQGKNSWESSALLRKLIQALSQHVCPDAFLPWNVRWLRAPRFKCWRVKQACWYAGAESPAGRSRALLEWLLLNSFHFNEYCQVILIHASVTGGLYFPVLAGVGEYIRSNWRTKPYWNWSSGYSLRVFEAQLHALGTVTGKNNSLWAVCLQFDLWKRCSTEPTGSELILLFAVTKQNLRY